MTIISKSYISDAFHKLDKASERLGQNWGNLLRGFMKKSRLELNNTNWLNAKIHEQCLFFAPTFADESMLSRIVINLIFTDMLF